MRDPHDVDTQQLFTPSAEQLHASLADIDELVASAAYADFDARR